MTEGDHKNSRIISVNSKVLNDCIDQDIIPIIPGFQGLTEGTELVQSVGVVRMHPQLQLQNV